MPVSRQRLLRLPGSSMTNGAARDDDQRSVGVTSFRSRMDAVRGRTGLALGSVFGDASSTGPVDDRSRAEVVRRQSAMLLDRLAAREGAGFGKSYTRGREIGQGMHATAYLCHFKNTKSGKIDEEAEVAVSDSDEEEEVGK